MATSLEDGPAAEAEVAAARRRASLAAAIAGLALAPYFWLASAVVGWPGQDTPPFDAPDQDFVDFYVNDFSGLPLRAIGAIGSWALWLLFILSVVRMACRRLDLAAIVAMTLAGAATAIFVLAEGVLAWPTIGTTQSDVSQHLDPAVARAMVHSRDGLHATASVPLGISMLVIAWLLARSGLWGHRLLGAVAALAGLSACTTMLQGTDPIGPGAILVWGIVVAVVIAIGRRHRQQPWDLGSSERPAHDPASARAEPGGDS